MQAAPHVPLVYYHVTCCHTDAGIGNGARVAAVVGIKCRGSIAGFALLSYPLEVALLVSMNVILASVWRHSNVCGMHPLLITAW